MESDDSDDATKRRKCQKGAKCTQALKRQTRCTNRQGLFNWIHGISEKYVWNIAQAGELKMWTLSCLLFTFSDWFGETCLHKTAFYVWMSACWILMLITSCWSHVIHKTLIMLWFMQGALDICIWTRFFIHLSFLSSGIYNEVLRCTVFSIHYVLCTLCYNCKMTGFPNLHACICT